MQVNVNHLVALNVNVGHLVAPNVNVNNFVPPNVIVKHFVARSDGAQIIPLDPVMIYCMKSSVAMYSATRVLNIFSLVFDSVAPKSPSFEWSS